MDDNPIAKPANLPLLGMFCSEESEAVLTIIQHELRKVCTAPPWRRFFHLNKVGIDGLLEEVGRFDVGLVLLWPDDEVHESSVSAGNKSEYKTRDNVILEWGMLLGELGRSRTIVLQPLKDSLPKEMHFVAPTDYAGINDARYHFGRVKELLKNYKACRASFAQYSEESGSVENSPADPNALYTGLAAARAALANELTAPIIQIKNYIITSTRDPRIYREQRRTLESCAKINTQLFGKWFELIIGSDRAICSFVTIRPMETFPYLMLEGKAYNESGNYTSTWTTFNLVTNPSGRITYYWSAHNFTPQEPNGSPSHGWGEFQYDSGLDCSRGQFEEWPNASPRGQSPKQSILVRLLTSDYDEASNTQSMQPETILTLIERYRTKALGIPRV